MKKKIILLVTIFILLSISTVQAQQLDNGDMDFSEDQEQDIIINTGSYVLDLGDKIKVTIYEDISLVEEGRSLELMIGEDGNLFLPMIGKVKAKGKTIEQLNKNLRKEYSEFLANPLIDIQVLEYSGLGAYLIGAVSRSGVYAVSPGISLTQFIAINGGLGANADLKNIVIIRKNDEIVRISLRGYFKNGDLSQDIPIEIGDKIYIPSKEKKLMDEIYDVLRFVGLALQIFILFTVLGQ